MSSSLLRTKLYIPPIRSNLVARPRLIEQLNKGLSHKLTLISAPAGFGKTTLLSTWITHCQQPVAWLSLDEADNDPTRFLRYFIAALQTIEGNIGAGALSLLQAPQPPPTESILTVLLNDMTTISDNFALVLDDYHVIQAQSVNKLLTFLLNHLPPQIHLIITSRFDPSLPLARLRGRGELIELRAPALRFTSTEAATFLNQVMTLNLAAEDINTLEIRTEGWIAGLQLVALALQGRADTTAFIQAFTGSHRFVLDYLVEEVLQRQPEPVRTFLLQTAVLNRLHSTLCNAVTGQENGTEMLATLERSNLFIVPLDNERQWYRYHHLFADVLQAHLTAAQPNQAPKLHQRASHWYEQHHLPVEAIHHAFAAEDFERAASLIQRAWPIMRQSYHETTLLNWVSALPDASLRTRPILSLYYALALLSIEPHTAETHLQDAEQWLDAITTMGKQSEAQPPATSMTQMNVVNKDEFQSLPGMIAVARAYHAGAIKNTSDTMTYAQQALNLLPEKAYLWRGSAAVLLGLTHWSHGDLEAAQQAIVDSLTIMQMTGNVTAAISTWYILADIKMAQGHLRQANRTSQQALKLAATHNQPIRQGTADIYVVLSELYREWNKLTIATEHLQTSKKLGQQAALQVTRHRWYIALAGIKEAQAELESALDLLDEAAHLQIRNPAPNIRPIAAIKARIWIKQNRLTEALAWLLEQKLSIDDKLNYLREFEHITMARVLIAQYRDSQDNKALHDAAKLLDRLLKAAEAGRRMKSRIEILILQTLIDYAQHATSSALEPLQQALKLAEPEGYVRLFIDEGTPMASLLSTAISHGIMPDYVGRLLTAFATEKQQQADKPPTSIPPTSQPLIEPLSPRELEVLQLIAQGLSNREISQRLFLALDTIKGHNRRIYGKLQVQRRTEAVARARELGLL